MAAQKAETKSNDSSGQASSCGRKLYPMTEEIYERGEKVFWEAFEKRMTELKAQKNQKEDSESKCAAMCDIEMTPSKPTEETDIPDELILTPSSSDDQRNSGDLVLEAGDIFKAEEITFEGEEEAEKRIAEAMSAYDTAMDQAAGIE